MSKSQGVEPPPPTAATITLWEKLISASAGALLTSLVTTPLDVAKTRLQTSLPSGPVELTAAARSCIYYPICKEADASFLRTACAHVKAQPRPPAASTLQTLVQVARKEGLRTLWSGITPALVMAVPSTTMYFTAYDELKRLIEAATLPSSALHTFAPMVAGITGRTLTVSVVAPLELMRTREMHKQSKLGLWAGMKHEVATAGLSSLWRGLAATLWRDVPFSGVYWLSYERLKTGFTVSLFPHAAPSFWQTFAVAFLSGTVAGAGAAVISTPFDVIKTRRQVQVYRLKQCGAPCVPQGTIDLLRFIAREEGSAGLFSGLGARIAKVAPACAIMISSYELGKLFFAGVEGEVDIGGEDNLG